MNIETVDEYVKKYVEAPHGNDADEYRMALLAAQLYREATGKDWVAPEIRAARERKAQ